MENFYFSRNLAESNKSHNVFEILFQVFFYIYKSALNNPLKYLKSLIPFLSTIQNVSITINAVMTKYFLQSKHHSLHSRLEKACR